MFVLMALLTIIGVAVGFILGRQYTEREVKAIESAKKSDKKKK